MKITLQDNSSPLIADIAFVSTDAYGTPGILNQFVMKELGYSLDSLPKSNQLRDGFFKLSEEGKIPIIFIVTVTNNPTVSNLNLNLNYCLTELKDDLKNKVIWIPLIGTGEGGLNYFESFTLILNSFYRYETFFPVEIIIALPSNLDNSEYQDFNDKIKEFNSLKSPEFNLTTAITEITTVLGDKKIFAVGSSWNNEDQIDRFIKNGIWENGDEDERGDIVNLVSEGDLLIIKSTFHQKSKGQFRLKAFGIVMKNYNNGSLLEVNWFYYASNVIDIEGSLSRLRYRIIQIELNDLYDIFNGIKNKLVLFEITKAILANYPNTDNIKLKEKNSGESKNKNDQTKFRSDIAVEIDELGRQSVAKEFVNLIKNDVFQINDNHSFIVHLQGEWGAGKSSFLKFISKELTSNQEENHWTIIEYNAWQNQHITPPWWTLLNNIYRKAKPQTSGRWKKVKLWFNETFRRIAWYSSWKNIFAFLLTILFVILVIYNFSSLSSLLITDTTTNSIEFLTNLLIGIGSSVGLIHSLSKLVSSSILIRSSEDAVSFVKKSVDPMSNIKKHYQKLVDNIKGEKGNIAIFIDDIDRCNDVYVVELLEGIQTLFKERKVLYIIAGDRKWISNCFKNVYSNFDITSNKGDSIGELFLQKTFQLSIRIPSISPSYREKYWYKMIGLVDQKSESLTVAELNTEQQIELTKEIENAGDRILNNQFLDELETKYNLSGDTVNNLIIDKVKQNQNEFEHALKDYHTILDINPRSILRLSNNYNISRAILISERKKYNPEKLVRWILIEELFPFILDNLQEFESIDDLKNDFTEKVKSKMEIKRFIDLIDGNQIVKGGPLSLDEIKQMKGI